MKRIISFLPVLICLLFLASCGQFQDHSDPEAPKKIESTDLKSFFCYTEASHAYPKQEKIFRKYTVQLEYVDKVENEDGSVSPVLEPYVGATFYGVYKNGDAFSYEVNLLPENLKKFQAIIEKHDLAKYNGIFIISPKKKTETGCEISAKYASGEEIYLVNAKEVPYSYEFSKEVSDLALRLFVPEEERPSIEN